MRHISLLLKNGTNEDLVKIKEWCKNNEDFTDIIRCLFYPSAKRQVKIIWYAIEEDSEVNTPHFVITEHQFLRDS